MNEYSENIAELKDRLQDNDLYVKTWSDSYDKLVLENESMKKLLTDAYTILAFAFNRIHSLPRTRDTELANDIAKLRAKIQEIINPRMK